MWLNNHFSQKPVTGRHRCNWKNSFQIITELWVKRRPISVQICIMCVACNGTKRSSLFLEQKQVTGVTKSTKSANNSVSRMFSLFFLLEFVWKAEHNQLNFMCAFLAFSFLFYAVFCCRDLPQYGHKQWQSYFGRTFDVYTKLWKFQQQHRLFFSCTV